MNKVTKIPYHIDREELFAWMKIAEDSPLYAKVNLAYEDLLELLPELLNVQGSYQLKVNDEEEKIHKGLNEVSHIVYCLVTLGLEISERSTVYFQEKEFLKGLMLDSMADIVLFNASNDFYQKIKKEVYEDQGYALTVRYSPDDSTIPMRFQKNILDHVNGRELVSVEITEVFMYNPPKTLGYIYGADKNIELAKKDHDCIVCSNLSCEYRLVAV